MPQFCEEAFSLQVSTCSQSVEKYSGEAEHPQNHPPNQPPNQQTTQPTNLPPTTPDADVVFIFLLWFGLDVGIGQGVD